MRRVIADLACVNGAEVAGGEEITERAFVSTDPAGLVDVGLNEKFDHCWIFAGGSLRVAPPSGHALELRRGTLSCSTDPDADFEVRIIARSAEVDVLDPVFSVAVEGERTRVSVLHGFVRVRSASAGSGVEVLVGPGRQAFVFPGADPGVEPFALENLPPRERKSLETLRGLVPPPAGGAPDPAGSRTLARILERGFVVAVDETTLDAESASFVETFLARLGREWVTRVRLVGTRFGEGQELLRGGKADAVVSPEPVAGARLLPFFSDTRERTWLLAVSAEEDRLAAALRAFLARDLESGEYGRLYEELFGRPTPYAVMEPLVAR